MTIQIKEGKILNEQEEILYDIVQTYSGLDIYTSQDFAGLKREERISKIIEMINGDERFSKLKEHIGAILTIGIGETLCLRTSVKKKNERRLYRFSFDNWSYSKEYPINAKRLIECTQGRIIGEHIRGGLVERLEEMLLETGKVDLIEPSKKEIRIKRKRMGQLLRIENFDEDLVYELKERGYSYDIIRKIGKDPLLRLDKDLIERVLSK